MQVVSRPFTAQVAAHYPDLNTVTNLCRYRENGKLLAQQEDLVTWRPATKVAIHSYTESLRCQSSETGSGVDSALSGCGCVGREGGCAMQSAESYDAAGGEGDLRREC